MKATTEHLIASAVLAKSVAEISILSADTISVRVVALDDAKASALGRLAALRCVAADGNPLVSDVGLGLLAGLPFLQVLDLEWCGSITNVGLLELRHLKQLQWLDLSFCRGITPEGVSQLRAALPECEIEFYGG